MAEELIGIKAFQDAENKQTKPSFISGLLVGNPDLSLIFPYGKQPEDDKKIGDEYCRMIKHDFLHSVVDPAEIERTGKIEERVIKHMAELGLFGIGIPKEYRGLGFSQTNFSRVLQLIASYCNILALFVSVHKLGATQILIHAGSEEQKRKYLPSFSKGEISAFALTAPDIGSDVSALSTRVWLNDEGTHYVVENGSEKLWTTLLPIAGSFAFFAKVHESKDSKDNPKITAFIIDRNTPGVTIKRLLFEGCRGIDNAYSVFDRVMIPIENMVGDESKGLNYALHDLEVGRRNISSLTTGMAKQLWLPTREWTNIRKTFGKPIGNHAKQTMRLARMQSTLFAMDSVLWWVAYLADRGISDNRAESAMAKVVCSEGAIQFIIDAQILWGGRGYETADSKGTHGESKVPVEQLHRDSLMYRIGEGATDPMNQYIVDCGLRERRKEIEDLVKAGSFIKTLSLVPSAGISYAKWNFEALKPFRFPKELLNYEFTKKNLLFAKWAINKLGRNVIWWTKHVLFHHKGNSIKSLVNFRDVSNAAMEDQGNIERIAIIATQIVVILTTSAHALQLHKDRKCSNAWILADQCYRDAKLIITRLLGEMRKNDDKETVETGLRALRGDFDWLLEGTVVRGIDDYK
jgi:alkylation response protein AidB-like acyl-CoA dehydrogenase